MRRADGALRAGQIHFARAAQNFRDAKVGDFHPALFIQQNVFRLDVAMHDALVMRELERLAYLGHNLERLARGKFAGPFQLPQIQAVHKFHDEIRQPARLAEFINRHDVRMIQFGERAGLAIEAFDKVRTRRCLRRQDFQRHDAVQRRLPRPIDRAHAAFANERKNFELRKQPGDLLDAGRLKRRGFRRHGGVRHRALLHQAGRAKPRQDAGGQRRAALRTFLFHVRIGFGFIHTPFY